MEKWRALDGDNTLALDWPLNEDSHVWEIGGFEGRWVQQIWDKFHCHITVFEPQQWAVGKMRERFFGNEKIDIRPYGLWVTNGKRIIGNYFTDGASIMPRSFSAVESNGEGEFKDLYTEIFDFEFDIDLTLMNIEGAEYTLIPDMVESGIIHRLDYFWCQFHPGLVGIGEGEYDYKMDDITSGMKKTHDLLWDCYPTAVAWKRI